MSKNKHMLYAIPLMILLIAIIIISNNINKQEVVIDDVVLKDIKVDKKVFGIYKEDENGVYQLSNDTTWPTSGYTFNTEKSGCINESGLKVENALSTGSNGKIIVTAGETVYCYIYFDIKKPAVTVTLNNYNQTYNTQTINSTTNDSAYFNTKYQAIVINNVGNKESKLTIASSNADLSSTKTKLSDAVKSAATLLDNEKYGVYSSATNIEQSGYNKTSEFYKTGTFSASTTSSTSGSTASDVPLAWDDTNKYWVSDLTQSTLTAARTYYYFFNVTEAGYYEVCYKKESGGSSNRLYLYKDTTNISTSSYQTVSSTTEKCVPYDSLTTSDVVKIGHYTPANTSSAAKLDIYLKKAPEATVNVGYRYEGKKPNNYIWFNNEMWRIIGYIPVKSCTTDACSASTSTSLVKIIRNESIGGLRWHTSSASTWSSSYSLYQVLNNYYLTKGNATGNNICTGTAAADCDYRVKGIGTDTYYGSMIQNVYWNTGKGMEIDTAAGIYAKEIGKQNASGKIGLMSASDYGYAPTTHTNALSSYKTYAGTNWLYGQGNEWTLTSHSSSSNGALIVYFIGDLVTDSILNNGYVVRPVLYLKDSVYVVSGNGTESSPYQVAIGS